MSVYDEAMKLVPEMARDFGRINGYQADVRREAVAAGYVKRIADAAIRSAARRYGEHIEKVARAKNFENIGELAQGSVAKDIAASIAQLSGVRP